MITVKIDIDKAVAEYIRGKYFDNEVGAVRFPPSSDIYITIYDLLLKRPPTNPVDSGNLEFALPDRREANHSGGKDPKTYNYISKRGASICAPVSARSCGPNYTSLWMKKSTSKGHSIKTRSICLCANTRLNH